MFGFNAVSVGLDKEGYEVMLIIYKFGLIQFFYWLEFSLLFKVALVCTIFAFLGCFMNFKNLSCQYIDENYEMPIMDSLLVIIVESFKLKGQIVAHAMQCHKSSYIKPITSSLLPHKIFIYNY